MQPMSKQLATIAAALVLAAGVGGAVGAGVALETSGDSAATTTQPAQPIARTTSALSAVYNGVKNGVVEIQTKTGGQTDAFGNETPGGGATGSGFVIHDAGHIITNQHVVDGAQSVTVRFANGKKVERYVEYALGHPTKPMSTARLREKLEDCLGYVRTPDAKAKSAKLTDAVLRLEEMKDVRELGGLLR